MNVRDLIPWGRTDPTPTLDRERDPFLGLYRDVNRLFDETFRSFGSPALAGSGAWPSVEIGETDKEIRISAELPGMDEKDVEVTLANGVLSIRGEKKSASKDVERQFSEFHYGSFERRIPVGQEVKPDDVKASFKNGVLDVAIPKSEAAQQQVKRIPIQGR